MRARVVFQIAGLVLLGLACEDHTLTVEGAGGQGGSLLGPDGQPLPVGPFQVESCPLGDPDRPNIGNCVFWTCQNVPTAYGHKTTCTTPVPSNPSGATPPLGTYNCTNWELYCPKNVPGGTAPWTCVATEATFTCDRPVPTSGSTGSAGSGGSTTPSTSGWMCQNLGSVVQYCVTNDCTSRETTCQNGTSPMPPGTPPVGGWNCITNEVSRVCYPRYNAPAPTTCPLGAQRWCDSPTFCSWGKQTCEDKGGGVYQWGACIEAATAIHDAPNTTCACYHPARYNPQCCEDPRTCTVMATRAMPCPSNGGLCDSCGDDKQCGHGMNCVRYLHSVSDTPNGGGSIQTVEQFCSKSCTGNSDCPSGYSCLKALMSPIRMCFPDRRTCL